MRIDINKTFDFDWGFYQEERRFLVILLIFQRLQLEFQLIKFLRRPHCITHKMMLFSFNQKENNFDIFVMRVTRNYLMEAKCLKLDPITISFPKLLCYIFAQYGPPLIWVWNYKNLNGGNAHGPDTEIFRGGGEILVEGGKRKKSEIFCPPPSR